MNIEHDFTNLFNTLNEYCEKFKDLYVENLKNDDRVASGQLINNVKTEVKAGNDTFEVVLQVADYYQWLENGRKAGKFPPVDAILDWIKVKNILPTPDKNGKLPTEKQLAFLIGRAIKENGTIKDKGYDGGHYVKKTMEALNTEYINRLHEALQKDFDEYSIKIWNGIDKNMIKT